VAALAALHLEAHRDAAAPAKAFDPPLELAPLHGYDGKAFLSYGQKQMGHSCPILPRFDQGWVLP
jgi:hypothetical protein